MAEVCALPSAILVSAVNVWNVGLVNAPSAQSLVFQHRITRAYVLTMFIPRAIKNSLIIRFVVCPSDAVSHVSAYTVVRAMRQVNG